MKRSVLITGASSGIGKACALSLAAEGYRVFAGVRKEADGEALTRALADSGAVTDGEIIPLRIDVTDAESVTQAASVLEDLLGSDGLDGLVNNAGIAISGPLEFLPFKLFEQQMRVNVNGQLAVTQACLPLLRRAKGRIVFMGSESGRFTLPMLGAYSASKFALEALANALRLELRRAGIHVSLVEPGSIKTPIFEKASAMSAQLLAALSSEAKALYARELKVLRALPKHAEHTAVAPEKVVRVVMHALSAKRPHTRYIVGLEAHLLINLFSLTPTRLGDMLMRNSFDLMARFM
jgi:NAD(P)-dependent dehydrogenase (short-subunit alcohol dehydrogenase family)